MDIIVRGRNVEIPEHYRVHVAEKLERLERYDNKLIRVDVELTHEKNKRQSPNCQHVEITLRSKGPVIRSESCAADFYAALDAAVTRLEGRLRKAADRRRVHHGRHTPTSVGAATTAAGEAAAVEELIAAYDASRGKSPDGATEDGLPGRVVREKSHPGTPMTVDEALENMELVGHDFYLFLCAETHQPTVVYRRQAYDYGLIRLQPTDVDAAAEQTEPEPAGVR